MRKLTLLIVALAMLATSGIALATPATGVRAVTERVVGTLWNDLHLNSDRIKFQTKDPVDVVVDDITYQPGATSGWHTHPGFVIVIIRTGNLNFYHADCTFDALGPGSTFVETGDDVVNARNESTRPVTLTATYVVPHVAGPAPVIRRDVSPAPATCNIP
jgi:quercetin dioxygenase-like cupin family protein